MEDLPFGAVLVTAVVLAEKLLLTPMAVLEELEEVVFPLKMLQKLTVVGRIMHDMLQKTLLHTGLLTNAKFNLLLPLVWQNLLVSLLKPLEQTKLMKWKLSLM